MKKGKTPCVLLAAVIVLTSCRPPVASTAFMPGSVILQLYRMGPDKKRELHFYRVSCEAPGRLAVSESVDSRWTKPQSILAAVSPDGRYAVYRPSGSGAGETDASENGDFRVMDLDTGISDALRFDDPGRSLSMLAQREDFSFSPDSSRLVYSDCRRIMLYDCASRGFSVIRGPMSETYQSGATYTAFAGNAVWVGSRALYFHYRAHMPFYFQERSNEDPRMPDHFAIVDLGGRVIKEGSVFPDFSRDVYNAPTSSFMATLIDRPFWPGCAAFDFVSRNETVFLVPSAGTEPMRTSVANFLGDEITPQPIPEKGLQGVMSDWCPAPDGRHILHVVKEGDDTRLYGIDMETGSRTALGAADPAYVPPLRYAFSADGAFCFSFQGAYGEKSMEFQLRVIPLSGEKPMTIGIKNTGYDPDGASPIACCTQ